MTCRTNPTSTGMHWDEGNSLLALRSPAEFCAALQGIAVEKWWCGHRELLLPCMVLPGYSRGSCKGAEVLTCCSVQLQEHQLHFQFPSPATDTVYIYHT